MILDGRKVAGKIYESLKKEIEGLKAEGVQPFLVVILVGEDPASVLYVKKKEEKAQSLGIGFQLYHFLTIASQTNLENLIEELNQNVNIHGIIVQLPLPSNFETEKVLKLINPQKDIDGLNGGMPPPTAAAIMEILDHYNINLEGQKVVIIGRGKLVGEPLEKILKAQNINLTVCDSKTADLKAITLSADIIISGAGVPGLLTADMVTEKTVVIDAGTAESSGKLAGDVEKSVYGKVGAYSPVPGGVGPVTVAELYKNLIDAAKK